MSPAASSQHDYIVVGSGAAGGTVAARLAEAGMRVLVLEAGPDPKEQGEGRASIDYDVPAFHALASENPEFAWPYWVRHFDDDALNARDGKADAQGRCYYPRAGALGGCTAHNAMIFLPPPDRDWDWLAAESADAGWSAAAMRRHRKAVENCRHRPFWRLLARLGFDPTGHGWSGWLPVEKAVPRRALGDVLLIRALLLSALADIAAGKGWREKLRVFFRAWGDPNDDRTRGREQLCYTPLATSRHARHGARERVEAARQKSDGRLQIIPNCLATRILFDGEGRACGVEWRRGRYLHRASPLATQAEGAAGAAYARGEIVLAAGAFATPQLLMLSGIGDGGHLRNMGIAPRRDLPAVGENLQDRYEIGLVYRMNRPWRSLAGARFAPDDPLFESWRSRRRGMYISNGAVLGALRRSTRARDAEPDLFLMGLMARFRGYYEGYAADLWPGADGFSWTVLKARTHNRAGSVRLASGDPRDPPIINFRNFAQDGEADLAGLVEGVAMARGLARPLIARGVIAEEETPGSHVTGEALRTWVRENAWGHHACGTAAIGPVLDAQGRVNGVPGLRVVDASIFPRIPGLFIVASVYLAAEKLAADILASARGEG